MNATTASTSSNDESSDVQQVLSGAERLLDEASSATADRAAELRDRAMAQLRALRERLADAQSVALEKGRDAARATDDFVHDNPWRVIAAAAAVGVAVGLLLNRR